MNKMLLTMIQQIENSSKPIKIGFPDGNDQRIVAAVEKLKAVKNIDPIIIDREFINQRLKSELMTTFSAAREGKKETIHDFEAWSHIPNYVAMALLKNGDIDCVVGGATTPTADLLRPALQIIGSKDQLITSYFWMLKNNEHYFLGDCAIIPEPNHEQLVTIAQQISLNVKQLFNIDPYIAMLSFSTNGSGGNSNASLLNVRQASEILKTHGFKVLGETQFDAAFDLKTQKYKWPQLNMTQRPNVYVFPNLNAGNIGYKIMKLTGDFEAIGPIITGLNKPVNDLSRGADTQEIFNLSIITANMVLKQHHAKHHAKEVK